MGSLGLTDSRNTRVGSLRSPTSEGGKGMGWARCARPPGNDPRFVNGHDGISVYILRMRMRIHKLERPPTFPPKTDRPSS